MRQFDLNNKVNPEKVFILQSSEIEKRLDPFYYVPSIRKLEEQVKKHKPEPLRKHILSVSSGATPKTTEKEKYYSDKENGIPFLRVQNLSPTGILDIENCKYINKETHENYLKRSQVEGGDLLVKITGVGRMAVASVAPDGFVGNTNQHMVVIKTGSKEKSELLAAYLNTDIAERLASRRATGGTRPALDYPALLSIPIILDEKILEIRNKAIEIKQRKEQNANKLLNSIDDYLLNELEIELPKRENKLTDRIFEVNYSELSSQRIDPNYIGKYEYLISQKAKYKFVKFGELLSKQPQYGANEGATKGDIKNDIRYIRITDIDDLGNLKKNGWKTALNTDDRYLLELNDLLFARSGSVGKCYIHKEISNPAIFAGYLIRFVVDLNKANPDFIFYYCNSSIYKFWVSAIERPAVQSNINAEEFKSLPIPLPTSLEKQLEIANYIKVIRTKADYKRKEANDALKFAKKEIENLILGEL